MENHPYSEIDDASPYLNRVAHACGLAENYTAITHPSLPNYLALTSGDTHGITGDCADCSTSSASIFRQLGSKGWRSYEEAMPTAGYTGGAAGTYTKSHNPATYFTDLSPVLSRNDVPLGSFHDGRFARDIGANRLPRYALVVPDKCHDEHDCSVATGDAWLKAWIGKIVTSAAYRQGGTAIFIAYDEGSDSDNRVYTTIISPYTKPGTVARATYNHYSMLKTHESMLGLPCLEHACDSDTHSMRTAFGL
jgi:phospholipase C